MLFIYSVFILEMLSQTCNLAKIYDVFINLHLYPTI